MAFRHCLLWYAVQDRAASRLHLSIFDCTAVRAWCRSRHGRPAPVPLYSPIYVAPPRWPEPEFVQLDKLLLEKAVKAVEDNLTEPDFDVTALADAMNMSRSTLTRKLKAITGRTPLDFIRNIKMKHARHMLEDKDKSVTEVAATLGYFNRKYFTTCFKEEFGMTPSEFQKSQHEE